VKYRFDEIAINSTEKKKPVEEDKNYYLGLEHLDPGQLKVSRFGSEVAPIGEKLIMKKGDVLFGKRRAYQKKVAIAPFDGIFSAHGMVLRPNEKVISKELFPFFISSDYFLDDAIRISVGSLSPTINWSDLRKLEFFLPAREEQDKLAELLWAIEENIEAYDNLILTTEELIKAKFVDMFYNDKTYKFKTVNLDKIALVTAGQTSPKEDDFTDEGVPFIKAGNLYDLINTKNFDEDQCLRVTEDVVNKYKLKLQNKGTIIFAKSGMSCMKGHVYTLKKDAYVVSHLACVYPSDSDYKSIFLEYFFKDLKVESLVGKNSYPTISISTIKKLDVSTPPKELQEQFAKFVDLSRESIENLKIARDNLQLVKKAIVKKYFG
jgi:type I restriction enzyme S subunit